MIRKWQEAFNSDLEEAGEGLFIPPEEDPDAPFFPRARGAAGPRPDSLITDPSRLPFTSLAIDDPDDFMNWPDEDPLTTPVIQQGPSKFYTVTNSDAPFRSRFVDPNLGREYLEPEQYDSPPPVLKDTTDPKAEALLYDAAIRFQDELRSKRIEAYEAKKARKALQHSAPVQSAKSKIVPMGLIYLSTSQNFMDPLHMGECSMGFYIDPAFRQNQLIVNAVNEVTKIAFTDHECHRLQSIVVDNDDKLPTLELLASA
jgi:RimJ/RimL family protein N-acetyltransferase